jgi:hypothetical protein
VWDANFPVPSPIGAPGFGNAAHGQTGFTLNAIIGTAAAAKESDHLPKDASLTIHFMSEVEYAAATGLDMVNNPIDITTPLAPITTQAAHPFPDVTPNYSYYPVLLTLTWTPKVGPKTWDNAAVLPRKITVMTTIQPKFIRGA